MQGDLDLSFQGNLFSMATIIFFNSKARKWRHDSDKTQTNKPEWRTIFLKHFLKQPAFLKHIFETKICLDSL